MNTFNVLTIFPEIFVPVESGIIGRAAASGLISIKKINIRNFSNNKHNNTDDYPYGGGEGMLMTVQPITDAWKSIKTPGKTIFMSPKGIVLNQEKCKELALQENLTLLCGRYEGIDERIIESLVDEEISIGDYVISGGETAAMILIDAVSRMIPGVLGNSEGYKNESHYENLLESPQYTRPEIYNGMKVPAVLLSGNHKNIEHFKISRSLIETYIKRPDILEKRGITKYESEILINEYPEKSNDIIKYIK